MAGILGEIGKVCQYVGVAGKEPDVGPTAQTVAANVKRFRGELNYTELSERLHEVAGWSINAVGIRRIESGERRVTPDDLVALALALGISPVTLLMPNASERSDRVSVTGVRGDLDASRLWEWLAAEQPLLDRDGVDENSQWVEFVHKAWPNYKIREIYHDLYERAVEENRKKGIGLHALAAELEARERGND